MEKINNNQPLDTEKKLFSELSEKERFSNLGENEAIQRYGYEMALRSKEQEERELSPEEKESLEKMTHAVKNIVSLFELQRSKNNKSGENLIVITDEGVDELIRLAFFRGAREMAGDDARMIVTKKPEQSAEDFGSNIGHRITTADAILLVTSKSRTHSTETVEAIAGQSESEKIAKLQRLRREKRSVPFSGQTRIISIPEPTIDNLTEGAALENIKELQERTAKVFRIFEKAEKMRITSQKGTDITINIKPKTVGKEDGMVSKPGTGSNFPVGEVGCAPQGEGTNGVYVIDGLLDDNHYVSSPVTLIIKNGIVEKIEGEDKDVLWLRATLDKQNTGKGNPYKLAEASLGMNSKAFRVNESGEKILPPSVLEAEKSLGTVHLAVGNNTLFLEMGGYESSDPDYNAVDIHLDFPIYDPTVEMLLPNNEKIILINRGKLTL
jgi:leucyl aminopeptidase (aminopeptidase T)